MTSLDQIVSRQTAHAESIRNDAQRTFDDASFPVGSVAAQGDLYIVRLAALPPGAKPRKDRQLAEGNTRGSRHVLSIGDCFDADPAAVAAEILRLTPAEVGTRYVGPLFRTRRGVAQIDHPEHGDHRYCGAMTCAVVYQRVLDAEQKEERVAD